MLVQTFLGLLVMISGFFSAYLYTKSLNNGASPLLLIIAVLLVVLGVRILFRASRSNATALNVAPDKPEDDTSPKVESLAGRLEKNNAIMSEWAKTENTRNRLKMLEMSAAADEKGKKI